MARRLFTYLTILGLLIVAGQCSRCKRKSFESIIDWELRWGKPYTLNFALPNLDMKRGFSLNDPRADKTYFFNPRGACWEFSRTGGNLSCRTIKALPSTNPAAIFAFLAGPTPEEQSLHVGAVEADKLVLYKYSAQGWETVVSSFDLADLGFTNDGSGVCACACSHRAEERLDGLAIINQTSKTDEVSIVLHYDAVKEEFKPDQDDWNYKGYLRDPISMTEVAPNRVFLLYVEDDPDNKVEEARFGGVFLQKDGSHNSRAIAAVKDIPNRLGAYLIQAKKYPLQKVVVVLHKKDRTTIRPECYTLEDTDMELTEDVPDKFGGPEGRLINYSRSVIIPFKDAIYLLAQDRGQLICAEGTLGAPMADEEAEQKRAKTKN